MVDEDEAESEALNAAQGVEQAFEYSVGVCIRRKVGSEDSQESAEGIVGGSEEGEGKGV